MIRCALVGFGYWGPNIARTIASITNINLTAVCDTNPKQLNLAKGLYKNIRIYQNIDSLLSDKTVEAVIIATPAITHFDLAKKAIGAGKHVLVEKPLTTNLSQAIKLKNMAQK